LIFLVKYLLRLSAQSFQILPTGGGGVLTAYLLGVLLT